MKIIGPAGQLECDFVKSSALEKQSIAVLCHPHPLYGGSMHDVVLGITSTTLSQSGVANVKFNFRGVGSSDGVHDDGEGECEDLISIVTHIRKEEPDKEIWTIGYSFGAHIVWKSLSTTSPEKALLIAPPNRHMRFDPHPMAERVSVIAGSKDEFVTTKDLKSLHCKSVDILEGGDHFLSGSRESLSRAISSFITS